jgi:hypothetical protein
VLVVSGATITGRPVALARASAALDAAACGTTRADPVCELSGPNLRATFPGGCGCALVMLWLVVLWLVVLWLVVLWLVAALAWSAGAASVAGRMAADATTAVRRPNRRENDLRRRVRSTRLSFSASGRRGHETRPG